MKKTTGIICLVALLAGCAHDRFALIDGETGKEIGHFTYRTGEKLMLDGKTYHLRKVGTNEQSVEQALKLTIQPEFGLRAFMGTHK